MKKSLLLLVTVLLGVSLSAQEKLPNTGVFSTFGLNFNEGMEVTVGAENFLGTNHSWSLYGLFSYKDVKRGEYLEDMRHHLTGVPTITKRLGLGEIGARKYFDVAHQVFYPFLGVGFTWGVQNMAPADEHDAIYVYAIERDNRFEYGATGTAGIEGMFTKNVGVDVFFRFYWEELQYFSYYIGAGLKFCF